MCRRHVCRHSWFSASKVACTHILTAIIRSPFLKIRGKSENKASSKAVRERERGGRRWVWWRLCEGTPQEKREWRNEQEEGGSKEEISAMLWCPSCQFGSSATYLSRSVALLSPQWTLCSPSSHLIMGLLLAEIATVWQSRAHSGASDTYFHLDTVVTRRSRSWVWRRTEVWGWVGDAVFKDLIVVACSVGELV